MNVEMENEEKRRILSVFDFTRRRMNLFPFSPNNNREIVRYSGLHISFAIDIYLYAIWWRSNSIFTAHTKRSLYPHKNHAINLCKCGAFVCWSRVLNARTILQIQYSWITFIQLFCAILSGPIVSSHSCHFPFELNTYNFHFYLGDGIATNLSKEDSQSSNLFHLIFVSLVFHLNCVHL